MLISLTAPLIANNRELQGHYHVCCCTNVQVNQRILDRTDSNLTITITATNNAPDIANMIQISENIPPEFHIMGGVTGTPSVGNLQQWNMEYTYSAEYGKTAQFNHSGNFNPA